MPAPVRPVRFSSLRSRREKPIAVFLDFDGTLVPIAPRPEQAALKPATRRLIQALSQYVPVVIVSGRSLSDIKSRIDLDGVVYAGNHGLEIAGRGLHFRIKNAEAWRRRIKTLGAPLRKVLGSLPGIFIEDKGCTWSIHYRLARSAVRRKAAGLFSRWAEPLQRGGRIRVTRGKAVWEIRPPAEWDKGRAVAWILRQARFRNRAPIYLGDDQSDHDAFRAIRRRGLGIAVGPRRKKGSAHRVLRDPNAVHCFLRRLLDDLRKNKLPSGF